MGFYAYLVMIQCMDRLVVKENVMVLIIIMQEILNVKYVKKDIIVIMESVINVQWVRIIVQNVLILEKMMLNV